MSFFKKIGAKINRKSEFFPKLLSILIDGEYNKRSLFSDLESGFSIAVISLPLGMAFAIGSGCTPERGLYTSVIASFIVSLLGGSRYQIAGPTGAFVAIIYGVVQQFGYDGLVYSTIMAGIMLIIFGLLKFGNVIKYLPFPIITGFTSGLGVYVLTSQIKNMLDLKIINDPPFFIDKIKSIFSNITTINFKTTILSFFSILVIFLLKKFKPKYPIYIITIVSGTLLKIIFDLDVLTIGDKFGEIPRTIPLPSLPHFSFDLIPLLFPSAFTISFLAGLESLLSCVIADTMSGSKHKSNCELLAHGIANIFSVCCGGIPATGTLARTSANVRIGAKTPMSGIFHALILFLMMFFFAPYAKWIPLSVLSSILFFVSANMIDIESIKYLARSSKSDKTIFFVTFLLTVFIDITQAVKFGGILSLIFFTSRMINAAEEEISSENGLDLLDGYDDIDKKNLPARIEKITIKGPFFFGIASKVQDLLGHKNVDVIIVEMNKVPFIDATGVFVLKNFVKKSKKNKTEIILIGLNNRVKNTLLRMSNDNEAVYGHFSCSEKEAIELAMNYVQKLNK